MKKFLTIFSAAGMLLVLTLVAPASAVVTYSLDDGTHENDIGLGAGDELWWANCFEIQPGGEIITSIEIYFSSTSDLNPAGQPFQVLLYDDTDDDGNPGTGLTLLTSGNFTTGPLDAWSSYDIPDSTVSGKFFAAAQITIDPTISQFPASLDETTSAGKSWISYPGLDSSNLHLIDFWGSPGNWMLRATGVPIPAPGAILLGSIGVGLVGWLRRRRTI